MVQNRNSFTKSCKKDSNFIECQIGNSGKTVMHKKPIIRRIVGRPKVSINQQLIERMLAKHSDYTSIDVQHELLSVHGIKVGRRTLQRRISEIRSKQRIQNESRENDDTCKIEENEKQLEITCLSEEAKKRRLDWALAHQDWTVHDWRNIFNMDDIKFIDGDSFSKDIYLDSLLGPEGSGNGNDLNLLEQLMAIIEPKIQGLAHPPKNVEEFRTVLHDVWYSDQEMVDKIEQLYDSMSWRVASVIKSGGDVSEF